MFLIFATALLPLFSSPSYVRRSANCDLVQKLGIALFVLCLAQLLGGPGIHFFKYKTSTRHPSQNYAHALLSLLLLIALSFRQVHVEYMHDSTRSG